MNGLFKNVNWILMSVEYPQDINLLCLNPINDFGTLFGYKSDAF